jgi:DMSO/TMAO reductase YedYZ heme-binding membrane subunit
MGQLWWFTARAGGIVSWCLLATSVIWGLAMSTRTLPGRVRPNWMLDVHRFLGGLAAIFVGVHVTAIVLDSYVHFGLAEVLVPFASSWHPVAVAWGIVGLYLLLAVELTSLARRRLPRRLWRVVHGLSFPLFGLATVHALTAGTDSGNLVWQVAVWGTTAAVVFLTVVRLLQLAEAPVADAATLPTHPTPTRPAHPARPVIGATAPWPAPAPDSKVTVYNGAGHPIRR